MKDLEIRGAGDLLGGEQSGFINDIGFETYQKILNEAINELKENEFESLFNNKSKDNFKNNELIIDTDFSLLFPDDYVNSISERLRLYTTLNSIKTNDQLAQFKLEIKDRFGAFPCEVVDLFDSVEMKWLGAELGLQKILMKQEKLVGYFINDQGSSFFESIQFSKILEYVKINPKTCKLIEKKTRDGLRLLLSFENIKTVQQGLELFKAILNS